MLTRAAGMHFMVPGTRVARRGGRQVDGHGTSSRLELWCSACSRQRDAGHGGAVCSRKDKPHGQDAHCHRGGSRNPHVDRFPLLSDRGFGQITALNRTSVAAPSAEAPPVEAARQVQASTCLSADKLGRRRFQPGRWSKPRLRDFTFRKPFCPSLVVVQPQSCSELVWFRGERGV
jgi:hypothetical protein